MAKPRTQCAAIESGSGSAKQYINADELRSTDGADMQFVPVTKLWVLFRCCTTVHIVELLQQLGVGSPRGAPGAS